MGTGARSGGARAEGVHVAYALDEVVEALTAGLRETHGLDLAPGGLTRDEEALMERLIQDKYVIDAWTLNAQAVTDLSSLAPR